MRLERLGLHELHVRMARSNRIPSRARRSRLGVLIVGCPKAPHSSPPMSSAMIRTTFGRSAGSAAEAHAVARPDDRAARRKVLVIGGQDLMGQRAGPTVGPTRPR